MTAVFAKQPIDIFRFFCYYVARYQFSVACYIFKLKEGTQLDCNRHLGGYIRSLANALAQDMRQNSEQLGLTPSQGMFLHQIWLRQEVLHQDTYARDLEHFFDIKHPTVSGILQRMEAAGFVRFEENRIDRRCKVIRLTQKAVDAHLLAAAHIAQSEARLTANMTEAEVQEFRRLLQLAADSFGVCLKPTIPQEKEDPNP